MEKTGAKIILEGTTPNEILLGRTDGGVFVMSMAASPTNKENRWTLEFSKAVHKAFDCIEDTLAADPPGTPASLLTISESEKFYSNGIDPAWNNKMAGTDELAQWNDLTMTSFARPILLPIPTVTAINGHAFGAGMMHALGHDHRLQKKERGYQCAIEVQIGIKTPSPELTLFRHSMSASAFYETCVLGKRWSGDEAEKAGIVSKSLPGAELLPEALKTATELAQLGKNRDTMRYYKMETKGFVAEEILNWEFANGKAKSVQKLPKGLHAHLDNLVNGKEKTTQRWAQRYSDFENAKEKRRLYSEALGRNRGYGSKL